MYCFIFSPHPVFAQQSYELKPNQQNLLTVLFKNRPNFHFSTFLESIFLVNSRIKKDEVKNYDNPPIRDSFITNLRI